MGKGISPLIAGVLLIAFTLAVAAIISGWLTSLTKTTTEKTEKGVSTQVECSKAVIEIDRVWENPTGNTSVLVHNKGTVDLTGGFSLVCGDNIKENTSVNVTAGSIESVIFNVDCSGTSSVTISSKSCPSVSDKCESDEDCWGFS